MRDRSQHTAVWYVLVLLSLCAERHVQGYDGGDCCQQTCAYNELFDDSCAFETFICMDPEACRVEADTIPPTLNGVPADAKLECSPYTGDSLPPWPLVSASDNAEGFIPLVLRGQRHIPAMGQNAGVGDFTLFRSWNSTDNAGNVAKASQEIVSQDTQPPIFLEAPKELELECGNDDLTDKIQAWATAHGESVAIDCSPVTMSHNLSLNIQTQTTTGVTQVQFSATDDKNMVSSMVSSLRIVDTLRPTLTTQPTNVSVRCNKRQLHTQAIDEFVESFAGAVFSDQCMGSQVVTSVINRVDGGCGNAPTMTMTILAEDANNNRVEVPVSYIVHNDAVPQITSAAQELVVDCHDPDKKAVLANWLSRFGGTRVSSICNTGLAFDNLETDARSLLASMRCGSSTEVSFTARDPCNSDLHATSTALFKHFDTQAPVLSIPVPNVTTLFIGRPFDGIPDASAADLEDGDVPVSVKGLALLLDALEVGPPGQYNITYSSIDEAGNLAHHIISYSVVQTSKSTSINPAVIGSSAVGGLAALLALLVLILFLLRRQSQSKTFKAQGVLPVIPPNNRISLRRQPVFQYENPLMADFGKASEKDVSRVLVSQAYQDTSGQLEWTANGSYTPGGSAMYSIPMEQSSSPTYEIPIETGSGADAVVYCSTTGITSNNPEAVYNLASSTPEPVPSVAFYDNHSGVAPEDNGGTLYTLAAKQSTQPTYDLAKLSETTCVDSPAIYNLASSAPTVESSTDPSLYDNALLSQSCQQHPFAPANDM